MLAISKINNIIKKFTRKEFCVSLRSCPPPIVSYGKKAPAGSRVFISKRSMYIRTYYRRGSWKDSERGPLTFAWKMKTCGVGRESHQ